MRGIVSYSKPANAPAYEARYNGKTKTWEVVGPDGRTVERAFASQGSAATFAGVANRQDRAAARKKDRPCLCCRAMFASEGIHNRLCPDCSRRGSAEAMPANFSFGSASGRRKGA